METSENIPHDVQGVADIASRTLFIAEVFRHVCLFADERTLARLARCCKPFREPALRTLWEHLFNLWPLMECFPDDVKELDERERYRFRRTLRTKDWAAFLTYAPYVRYLGKPKIPSGSPFVPPDFFEAVCALRPQYTLLPNVLELAVDSLALRHWVIPHLLAILGKGLQVASIYWNHTSEDGEPSGTVAATLDILSDFHQLQEVTLDGDPGLDDEPPAALLRYLGTRPQLTKFECCNIPLLIEGIAYLANLPSLRTVHIRLPDTLSWSSHSLPDKPFSTTESFSLHSTVESYTAFAQRVALPYVQRFSIFLTAAPAAAIFPMLFISIRRQFHPSTLIGLDVRATVGVLDPLAVAEDALDDGVLVSSDHLRPLLDFRKLRHVTVVPPWGFSFDDDFCHDMAKAWPLLEELRFAHKSWCIHAPLATTVRALSYFAAYCPELRYLGIKFDAMSWMNELPRLGRKIPASYYDALRGKRSVSKVRELRAELEPIACPEQVALYLLRLFPDLRACWRAWHSSEDTEEEAGWRASWQEVERYLGVMAEMREDGKRWNLVDEHAG